MFSTQWQSKVQRSQMNMGIISLTATGDLWNRLLMPEDSIILRNTIRLTKASQPYVKLTHNLFKQHIWAKWHLWFLSLLLCIFKHLYSKIYLYLFINQKWRMKTKTSKSSRQNFKAHSNHIRYFYPKLPSDLYYKCNLF